jgi:hypothetical protein
MKSSRGTLFRKHLKAQREITSSDKTVTAATIMSARENVGSGVWQGECVSSLRSQGTISFGPMFGQPTKQITSVTVAQVNITFREGHLGVVHTQNLDCVQAFSPSKSPVMLCVVEASCWLSAFEIETLSPYWRPSPDTGVFLQTLASFALSASARRM